MNPSLSLTVFSLLYILTLACKTTGQSMQSEINEIEITGTVYWLEGNFMPGPGRNPEDLKGIPVSREIWIYEPTKIQETTGGMPLFQSIDSKLITKVTADDSGEFNLTLPEGTYSFFTKEDEGFFASTMDGDGHLGVFTFSKEGNREAHIKVDYNAAY